MAWVWVLLGICALIVLHEGGHFLAAKAVGMRAERFSLFFGNPIISKTIGETQYGIGWIPLGGYVKITGMSPDEVFDDPAIEARAYYNQPVWKRIVVIAAGPFVNLVVAFAIFAAVIGIHGIYQANDKAQVESVVSASAATGQLKPGDILVSVNGRSARLQVVDNTLADPNLTSAIDAAKCAKGATTNGCVASPAIKLVVDRNGKLVRVSLHPRYDTTAKRNLIGVSYGQDSTLIKPGLGSSLHLGWQQMWSEISGTASALAHIYQSKDRKQFHSIAGAATAAEEATSQNTSEGLFILGGLSLALAIVNLLPFLPLDGGHIFWALVEKVRRRKVTLKTMERASYVGLALVLCLFVIGFSNDISTFVHGGNFLGTNTGK